MALSEIFDNLDRMWFEQMLQQDNLGLNPSGMAVSQKSKLIRDLLLGLYEEVQELSGAVQYKNHLLKNEPISKTHVTEEIVDVLKYLICVAQFHQITPDEVSKMFTEKTEVIQDRALGSAADLRNTKFVITDLDGCVCDMSDFQKELAQFRNESVTPGAVSAMEQLKNKFYRNGGFRHIPMISGAKEGLKEIREAGYKLVIITARPYWTYKRLYSDTIIWLKKHEIEYDLLLFNKDKSEAIHEEIFPATPKYFIEDRAKHVLELVNIGIHVLWLNSDDVSLGNLPNVKKVVNWQEIVKSVLEKGK